MVLRFMIMMLFKMVLVRVMMMIHCFLILTRSPCLITVLVYIPDKLMLYKSAQRQLNRYISFFLISPVLNSLRSCTDHLWHLCLVICLFCFRSKLGRHQKQNMSKKTCFLFCFIIFSRRTVNRFHHGIGLFTKYWWGGGKLSPVLLQLLSFYSSFSSFFLLHPVPLPPSSPPPACLSPTHLVLPFPPPSHLLLTSSSLRHTSSSVPFFPPQESTSAGVHDSYTGRLVHK